MANVNCSACDDIRETDPSLIVNGWSSTECTSMKNNTGLSPSSGHSDFTDLNNMADCLIGNMESEIEAYDVCDWKDFMRRFIPNLWTMLKGIICAIGGLWTKVNCTYNALRKLVNLLDSTTGGTAFVRYFRNNGEGGGDFWYSDPQEGDSHTIDMYMDASGDNAGSAGADRDYVVIIQNCTNFRHFRELEVLVTFYASDDTRSLATIRNKQAQHPTFNQPSGNADIQTFSWTTSGAVLVRKGAHVKINSYVGYSGAHGSETAYRLHQFVATWIPVNVDDALDPTKILTC